MFNIPNSGLICSRKLPELNEKEIAGIIADGRYALVGNLGNEGVLSPVKTKF